MTVDEELDGLFDELADDHTVGSPPVLVQRAAHLTSPGPRRSALLAIFAVAACFVVVVAGLVAIGSRNSPTPAASPITVVPGTDTSPSDPAASSNATTFEETTPADPDLPAPLPLLLVRIEARTETPGTTSVVLVFDSDLPNTTVELLGDITTPTTSGIGYITQNSKDASSDISVCGSTHRFPPPGNQTVDIFVPGDWFDPQMSVDAPVVPAPDSGPLSKIVTCQPRNNVIQISVWGSASGRSQDVDVTVDANIISVDIAPDPTDSSSGAVAVDGPSTTQPVTTAPPESTPTDLPRVSDDGLILHTRYRDIELPRPLPDFQLATDHPVRSSSLGTFNAETVWYQQFDADGTWLSDYTVELVFGDTVAGAFKDPSQFGYTPAGDISVNGAQVFSRHTGVGTEDVFYEFAWHISDDEAILVGSRWASLEELLKVVAGFEEES